MRSKLLNGGGEVTKEDVVGKVLVMPAVGLGNVGQIAIDILLNTIKGDAGPPNVEKVARIASDYVLPMAGNDPLDLAAHEKPGTMCSSLELFNIRDSELSILQIRAPIVEGCQEKFASELQAWTKEKGFSKIVMIGAGDASANFEEEVMLRKLRYLASENFSKDVLQSKLAGQSIEPLKMEAGQPSPLVKAGLLSRMHKVCNETDSVPFLGLILFCKEGSNVVEGMLMAAALNSALDVIPKTSKTFSLPETFRFMDGANHDVSLFN